MLISETLIKTYDAPTIRATDIIYSFLPRQWSTSKINT